MGNSSGGEVVLGGEGVYKQHNRMVTDFTNGEFMLRRRSLGRICEWTRNWTTMNTITKKKEKKRDGQRDI